MTKIFVGEIEDTAVLFKLTLLIHLRELQSCKRPHTKKTCITGSPTQGARAKPKRSRLDKSHYSS